MSEGKEMVQVKVEPLYTDNEANLESESKAEEAEHNIHRHVKKEPIWNVEDYSPTSLYRDQVIEKDHVSHTSREMNHIGHEIKKETEQNHTEDSQVDWCMDHVVKVEREVDISDGSKIASQVNEHTQNTLLVQSKVPQTAYTDHDIKKENESAKNENTSSISEATTTSGHVDQAMWPSDHVVKIERVADMYSANNVVPQHEFNKSESKLEQAGQKGDEKAVVQSGLSTDQMVKAESAVIGLYMDHVVKDELVVGPEVLQRPKLLPQQATINHIESKVLGRRCSIRLEKMHVDVESGMCRVGLNTYKLRICLQNYQDNHVKNEVNRSTSQKPSNKSIKIQEKRYKCDLCNYATDEKYRLKVHGKVHSNEKPFKCNLCSYSTAYKAHLQIHDRIHTGERPYKCDQCSYASIQKCDLSVHKRVHSGEKPHKCSHCSFACKRKRDLLAHERTHKVEKPFKCDHCDYSSNRKRDLLIHVSRTHSLIPIINDQNTYKCDHCTYTSPTRRNWKNHIRIVHMKIKPYKCDQCDYETRDKIRFGTHVKKHTGEPIELRYKCSQCNYATDHKHHMLGHQRTHSGEKPFKCSHCSYATAYRRELVAHKALHNEENPYKCIKCTYACGSESNLRNHERTHIGDSANKLTETLTET
ncbi:zinc finger protein 431-like [Cydia strobilella]|uniref:zinc finger protein 431-like n=1 Tax=Cydia strobilella TaxID=1100964 RepID=UPI0030062B47